nr:immunoglobulin light chain junction region [Macaca mulatta]
DYYCQSYDSSLGALF